jgi:hypothetical protein
MADDDDNQSSSGTGSKKSTAKSSKSSRSSKSSSSAKKSTSRSSGTSSGGSARKSSGSGRRAEAPRAESSPRTSPARLAANAAQQLLELTGRDTEGVIGLEKDGDGWRVQVEVVEVRRIPNTTDVLALYEIDADDKGNLEGYRRIRRYVRGSPDEGR